jgi:DNA-directed RNA polymerase subunit RPC12/RpoP
MGGVVHVMRLRCEDCGTPFYSAAGRAIAERGERCSVCGGKLVLDEPPERPRHIRVAADREEGEDTNS